MEASEIIRDIPQSLRELTTWTLRRLSQDKGYLGLIPFLTQRKIQKAIDDINQGDYSKAEKLISKQTDYLLNSLNLSASFGNVVQPAGYTPEQSRYYEEAMYYVVLDGLLQTRARQINASQGEPRTMGDQDNQEAYLLAIQNYTGFNIKPGDYSEANVLSLLTKAKQYLETKR